MRLINCLLCVTAIALSSYGEFGPIVPKNVVKETIKEAVRQANLVTTNKRDNTDLAVYDRVNEMWTWTSTDPTCPAEFLTLANACGAPKLHYQVVYSGTIVWSGINFFYPNGKTKYMMTMFSAPTNSLSLTPLIEKRLESGEVEFKFNATATRTSATDNSLVKLEGVRLATTDDLKNGDSRAVKAVDTSALIREALSDVNADTATLPEVIKLLQNIGK